MVLSGRGRLPNNQETQDMIRAFEAYVFKNGKALDLGIDLDELNRLKGAIGEL